MVLFHFFDEDYEEEVREDVKQKSTCINESRNTTEECKVISRLSDFKIYEKHVHEAKKWFQEYGNPETRNKIPQILLIMGKKGCGKSLLAKLLLKEYQYDEKEIICEDQFTKKQTMEMIKNAFLYKNVNEYEKDARQYGFIFDDIELMLELGDNVIFNELMCMVKSSKRLDLKREKESDPNYKPKKSKSKSKSKSGDGDDQPASKKEDDHLLYNPIVCTCNYTNDKKMNELRKICKVIDLNAPCDAECDVVLDYYTHEYQIQPVEKSLRREIYEYCEYDLRKIGHCVNEIRKFNDFKKSTSGVITKKEFQKYKIIYGKVDINCQLNEATMRVFKTPLSIGEIEVLYSLDTLLIPLMIHHNLLNYISKSTVRGAGVSATATDFATKFEVYEKCMESLCFYDKTQTYIYKNRDWDMLPSLTAIESLYVPNMYLQKLELRDFKIEFTNILNKISQLEVNRKMVQNAHFSVNRMIVDDDELIYLIEMFLNYLQIDRSICEDVDEEGAGALVAKSKKQIIPPNKDYELSLYKKMIQIMNKYNIDMKSLEMILKIEKLNIFENKNPKRLSSRVKEELEYFVTAQSIGIEEDD